MNIILNNLLIDYMSNCNNISNKKISKDNNIIYKEKDYIIDKKINKKKD